jgi:hypothetical protein
MVLCNKCSVTHVRWFSSDDNIKGEGEFFALTQKASNLSLFLLAGITRLCIFFLVDQVLAVPAIDYRCVGEKNKVGELRGGIG